MEEKTDQISVATFNIRTDTPEDGKQNKLFDWSNRVTYIKRLFDEYQWDIVGLQEVRENQLNDLRSMEEYDFVGKNRWDDEWGEYNPIFYKKEKMTLLSSDTFWLSKTPKEQSIAEYWGAITPRICTIAHFKIKKSGKEFVVVNTHFDHDGEEARYQASQLVMERISSVKKGLPIFLMGDFNGTEKERWYTIVNRSLNDIMKVSPHHIGPLVTCTTVVFAYRPTWDEMKQIDYIFVNDQVEVVKTATVTDQFTGIYPSDHFPVTVISKI